MAIVKRQGGGPKAAPKAPVLPRSMAYLWAIYNDLDDTTFAELEAYGRLAGVAFSHREVAVLRALSRAHAEHMSKQESPP